MLRSSLLRLYQRNDQQHQALIFPSGMAAIGATVAAIAQNQQESAAGGGVRGCWKVPNDQERASEKAPMFLLEKIQKPKHARTWWAEVDVYIKDILNVMQVEQDKCTQANFHTLEHKHEST